MTQNLFLNLELTYRFLSRVILIHPLAVYLYNKIYFYRFLGPQAATLDKTRLLLLIFMRSIKAKCENQLSTVMSVFFDFVCIDE